MHLILVYIIIEMMMKGSMVSDFSFLGLKKKKERLKTI